MVLVQILSHVVSHQWSVQQEWEPEPLDQKQDSKEGLQGSLRNDPRVQSFAQSNRVHVVTFQIRVGDGNEHLTEQVDGVGNHCKNKQAGSVSTKFH